MLPAFRNIDANQRRAHYRNTRRAVVSIGMDGASQPMLRYQDELHLPDSRRSRVLSD